ncbi:hypothetical protein [Geobacillus sp. JS12]|uniref:hypothetical protein n=1 Tax=Geobacillus sp. JS12 TaxID=1813182 RepID=UPI00078B7582|nr:hypothetical protein [Geobacillus sp. JS12]AMQ20939.1 hypothetical protein A0V43_08600 [Geobacillus sp. JS12]
MDNLRQLTDELMAKKASGCSPLGRRGLMEANGKSPPPVADGVALGCFFFIEGQRSDAACER